MVVFWRGIARSDVGEPGVLPGAPAKDFSLEIRELRGEIQRLMLLNQAMWELVRSRLQLTDKDLDTKAHEVDMRDGVEDGSITHTALKCPTCGRVSSSKHWRCLYCGQEFEKPVMG